MAKIEPKNIRNIGFFGHGGCGKTTIIDGILYLTGENTRVGRVDDGTSLMDFDPEEIERKTTINLSVFSLVNYNGKIINIVDTPGYLDFVGEVLSGIRAIDVGVVVIDATSGVEVGTELVWKYLEEEDKARAIFVNKLKKENADFDSVYKQIVDTFGHKICPITIPIGQGPEMQGYVNLLTQEAFRIKDGKEEKMEIPEDIKKKVAEFREKIIESLCEEDESLMEKYLEGIEIKVEEIIPTIAKAVANKAIFPLFAGDGYELIGLTGFLNFVAEYFPSPLDVGVKASTKEGNKKTIKPAEDNPTIGFVFKTFSDPHVGEMLNIRVLSGKIIPGMSIKNTTKDVEEKINQIFVLRGRERKEVSELVTGMLGVLVKLKSTKTSDTLATDDTLIPQIKFPEPSISVAVVPKTKGDEERVSNALARLHEEDPTFKYHYNVEFKQQLIEGIGELHLDVILSRLKRKFNVSVDTEKPKIAYRETITKKAEAQGKYKKQTGGRGQYGDVWLRLEPLPRGKGFEFEETIFGGAIPSKYFPSIEKGIKEAAEKGILAGYPVIDFKATLYDGSHHPVDSSDIAFKIAASMAFKNCAEKANPVLLEPILEIEVLVPEKFMGDVIGDLNSRRAKILGIDTEGRFQKIRAYVPEAEMYKYATTLRSITQGRGIFRAKFSHYEEVPKEIAQKIIEQAKKEKEKEE